MRGNADWVGHRRVSTGGGRGRLQTSGRTAREPWELQKTQRAQVHLRLARESRPFPRRSPPPTRQSAGGGRPRLLQEARKGVAKHVTAHLRADAREARAPFCTCGPRSERDVRGQTYTGRQALLLGALKLGLQGTLFRDLRACRPTRGLKQGNSLEKALRLPTRGRPPGCERPLLGPRPAANGPARGRAASLTSNPAKAWDPGGGTSHGGRGFALWAGRRCFSCDAPKL